MADCHPYRIATTRGESTLIWRPGEGDDPDALAVDDLGRLLTFRDLATLEDHCDRNGWELVREGEATLDLAAVRRWVETPDDGPVSAGQLLEAWNFFDDLSHSLDDHPALPSGGRSRTAPTRRSSAAKPSSRPPQTEPGRTRRPQRCVNCSARDWSSGSGP
ncbi:hypothetical protein QA942_38695 [Streptomyces sp. B21-106]|uniref:hypothetical protein n=1 Tax=Streptomyces sp. B21-106 TaxID=3039418 RepID=UPI002FF1BCAA